MKLIFGLILIWLPVLICQNVYYDDPYDPETDIYVQNCIPGQSFYNGCGNSCRCKAPGKAFCTLRACVSAEMREEFIRQDYESKYIHPKGWK
ncbi:hypothetical protein PVAND_005250 [Polypedilum vanderplanki]|uniref:Pacifastin domain-containing protein n=1 Tax=Polypedilum vanderplanki TaxID=319348 RepID=A0A9J6BZL4_POLVA|nr:hypothetical protein PVAND_005250 [Polypedilum vanderplanki]